MTPGRPTAAGQPDTSARRVLKILLYLARLQRPVRVSALARDCQYPRTSIYRLLHVMDDMGFVTYYPDESRWGLGPASYELGTGYLLSDPLARQSMSILIKLAAQTGGFTAIGVLDGTEVIVSRAHLPESTTEWSDFEPGARYPAHLTAMGRALLIGRPRGDLLALYGNRPLARPNGTGPSTIDELLEQLEQAKERGYAESPADLADGIWAFASPVFSAAGRIVAALAAGFLAEPPTGEDFDRMITALLSGAEQISNRLGYRRPEPTPTRSASATTNVGGHTQPVGTPTDLAVAVRSVRDSATASPRCRGWLGMSPDGAVSGPNSDVPAGRT